VYISSWFRTTLTSIPMYSFSDNCSPHVVYFLLFFLFYMTALAILVLSGLVLLPVLLPVAATDDNVKIQKAKGNQTFSDIDKLLMGNVKVPPQLLFLGFFCLNWLAPWKICLQGGSPRLWAFLIATYWVSLVTYFLLWKAYVHVSGLRANALMSPELKPEQFAVLVRDIPPVPEGQTRKEQVDSYFKSIYPETFYRSMVVTNNKEVFFLF